MKLLYGQVRIDSLNLAYSVKKNDTPGLLDVAQSFAIGYVNDGATPSVNAANVIPVITTLN